MIWFGGKLKAVKLKYHNLSSKIANKMKISKMKIKIGIKKALIIEACVPKPK